MTGKHLLTLTFVALQAVNILSLMSSECTSVAICFSGHLRTFASYPSLQDSTLRNLVEAISPGCDKTTDVFGYITMQPASENDEQRIKEEQAVQDFKEKYKPKRIKTVIGDQDFDSTWSAFEKTMLLVPAPTKEQMNLLQGTYKFQKNPWSAVETSYLQYSKIAACFALVRDYERKERNNVSYEWIVRTRFDTFWLRPLAAAQNFPRDRVWIKNNMMNGVHDMFSLIPRHLADDFFGAAAALFPTVISSKSGEKPNNAATAINTSNVNSSLSLELMPPWWAPELMWQPETFLWYHMRKNNIPFGRASIPMVLLRDFGPDCLDTKPWELLLSALQLIVGFDNHGPGRMNLAGAFKRAYTMMCFRKAQELIGLEAVDLTLLRPQPSEDAMTIRLEEPWSAAANMGTISKICHQLTYMPLENCLESFQNFLWQEGLAVNLPGETEDAEILWATENLIRRFGVFGTSSHTFHFTVKTHNDPAERYLQPPSMQSVVLNGEQGASLIQNAACVYLWMHQRVIALTENGESTNRWPTNAEGERCLENMEYSEVNIFAKQLDDGLLTCPTWGSAENFLQMSYERGYSSQETQEATTTTEVDTVELQ